LEAVIEFQSKQAPPATAGKTQALSYAGYLLGARPDRVAVFGLYLGYTGFTLILVSAAGVYCTKYIPWTDSDGQKLLLRVLYHIHKPPPSMIDPTIIREEGGTFEIQLKGKVFNKCKPLWTGPPIGRRTTIFYSKNILIKEQYLRISQSTPPEAEILKKAHLPAEIPGVIRVGDYELVTRKEDQSAVACGLGNAHRQKIRLELKDKGSPFMDVKTPKGALIAAWDLLEGDYCAPRL
jgi:hypothetical protein